LNPGAFPISRTAKKTIPTASANTTISLPSETPLSRRQQVRTIAIARPSYSVRTVRHDADANVT